MSTPGFPYRLVTFDVDGTLTRGHGWEVIARAAGREAEFRACNRRFLAGKRNEDQHLHDLLELAVGLTRPRVEELLEVTPRVGGIRETLRALQERGAQVALLTHNPEYVVAWYRRSFGFDDAEGTSGTVFEGDRIMDAGPARADKLGGLARLLERHRLGPGEVAHVGDGGADVQVFQRVGTGISFNSTNPGVEAAADRALRSEDLRAILPVLDSLRPRPM